MTNKTGIKHLIKCRCVMPQFKNLPEPPQHQFIVFSIIEDDQVLPKHAQCNNCGIIHKVIDICKSDIVVNKVELSSLLTIDDIRVGLPENLVKILDINMCDFPTSEMVNFYYENKLWGNFVVLNSEYEDGTKSGKYLQILGENLFKVNPFSRNDIVR
jgi:hypothetical protein